MEVELWDKANNVGEPAIINPKKYLVLMECIRNNEDEELKRIACIEIARNQELNTRSEDVIKTMIRRIKQEAVDLRSRSMGQREDESVKDYITRLEQTAKTSFIALMDNIKEVKDKNETKKEQENKPYQKENIQGEKYGEKERLRGAYVPK